MALHEILVIALAGGAAGMINTIVGSGTLVTFPTLLAFGVPPVTANISNAIGLVPGGMAGAFGYRRELVGQRDRVMRLASATVLGAVAGALLLVVLPADAFAAIVPVLILLGVALVIFQPRISAWVTARHAHLGGLPENGARWVWPATGVVGVYCGYFGAAQGVLLMGLLGSGIDDSLQRLNGAKNVLAALGNAVAGLIFVVVAFERIDWVVALVIALGSVAGSLLGATIGRRLPPLVLRAVIVVVGLTAVTVFLAG